MVLKLFAKVFYPFALRFIRIIEIFSPVLSSTPSDFIVILNVVFTPECAGCNNQKLSLKLHVTPLLVELFI